MAEDSITTMNEQPPSFEEAARTASIHSVHSLPANVGTRPPPFASFGAATHGSSSVLSSDVFGRRGRLADLHEDEELPDYEPPESTDDLPDYQERHLLDPVVSYNVFQITRKLQVLTPTTRVNFDRLRYRITAKSGVFSKKADFTLTRLPTGAQQAAENSPGKDVGTMNFDRATQIPWMPRATVQVISDSQPGSTGKMVAYDMSAGNFQDWRFKFHGEDYFWRLTDKPTALSLYELNSESVVARFTYSAYGTDASRGADVGTLDIFGGSRSEDLETIEVLLCTCWIPVVHWRNMGRHYRNDVTPRNCSVGGVAGSALGGSFLLPPRDGSISGSSSRTTRANSAV